MQDPNYLLHVSEGAEEIAEQLHGEIIKRIVNRIMLRIGRGDDYILTAQDKWQLETLQQAGYLLEDIQKEIAKATKLQQTEIAEAMEEAGVKALEYDDEVYRSAGLSPAPFTQSPELIRIAQRNYEATMGEFRNFTRTMAQQSQQLFISECDRAYTLVSSGALSYTEAVKEVINNVVSEGVKVTYPSGRSDTIETATLRAVRTGISQMSAQITDARMEEMNWDIVLVSSHLGARVTDKEDYTNHYWWQGKFYSKSGKDKRFTSFSVCGCGKIQGLCGANCRHSYGPGDGEHNPFKEYDSEENRKQYEKEQNQRTLERRIRDTKREVMGLKEAVDNCTDIKAKFELDLQYQKKATLLAKQNKSYKEYCESNNLRTRADRIQIAKWDRQQAAAARGAAKRYKNYYSSKKDFKEQSHRTKSGGKYGVNWKIVKSKEYTERFSNLSDNPQANILAAQRSRNALSNRDRKNTEELYAISLTTGKDVSSITNQHIPFGVKKTDKVISDIARAEKRGEKVLLIHNHPQGLTPSLADLNELFSHNNTVGITVGHNGSIYYYSKPSRMVTELDFAVAFKKNKMYNGVEQYERAMMELARQLEFDFKIL